MYEQITIFIRDLLKYLLERIETGDVIAVILVALFVVLLAILGASIPALVLLGRKTVDTRFDDLKILQNKRLDKFEELWNSVAGICTPYSGKETDPREVKKPPYLDSEDLLETFKAVSDWYKKYGLLLDSESRLLTLLLREMCAKVLRDNPKKNTMFMWRDNIWPRLWLIKTALRISLESAVSAPRLRVMRHRTWPRLRKKHAWIHWVWLRFRHPFTGDPLKLLKDQLEVKFDIVDSLAVESGQGNNKGRVNNDRSELIKEVIDMFSFGEMMNSITEIVATKKEGINESGSTQ
ncbi:hypothetical protein JYU19_01305 [bacterium AH-315-J21]|nr:hypothetical protein [bacterium AH-315-J21]